MVNTRVYIFPSSTVSKCHSQPDVQTNLHVRLLSSAFGAGSTPRHVSDHAKS